MWRIIDLRQKIDLLKGLLGYAFEDNHLSEQAIARGIGTTPTQWARKAAGVVGVGAVELGKLLLHFQLAPDFDWRVFRLPFDEFETAMLDKRVGTHGESDGMRALQRLLSDPRCRAGGIWVVPLTGVRGGLGVAATDLVEPVVLAIRTRAKIRVETPDRGHLVVLNQHSDSGETTCLVPSLFCSSQKVPGGRIEIPDANSPQPAFVAQGPRGHYRLLAIWARRPIAPSWLAAMDADPRVLDGAALKAIADDARSRTEGTADFLIRTGEYRVAG